MLPVAPAFIVCVVVCVGFVWGLCVSLCSARSKRLDASYRSAQYERMYVVCSLVGIHCFEIAHVSDNVILITK